MADIDEQALEELEYPPGDIFQTDEQREEVVGELVEGYDRVVTDGERQRLLEKVAKWRRQREGRPEQDEKTFPWVKASKALLDDRDR